MKRIATLILALVMVLGVFAFAQAEELEHLDIKVGNWDMVEFGNDPIGQVYAEKFNFDIEVFNEDWGNYEEQIQLWGNADELPDVFCGYIDEAWFGSFIDQELIRDIPLETLQQYPNLYAFWQKDAACQAMYDFYGKIYYYPRNDGNNVPYEGSYTGGMGLYYRADWAEKLGFAEPTNMDELLEMLTAFAKNDPDGNGVDDTYGITTTFARLEGLWSWFNCYPDFWVDGEEGVIPGYLDKDNMLEALKWLRAAYEAGAIDPEWQGQLDGFTSGTFGAYLYHSNPGWAHNIIFEGFEQANPDLGNALAIINNVTCLPAHEGIEPTTRPYYCDGMSVFSADCTDEIMNRMLAFMDWVYSEEGWMLTMYGFEGEDYEYDADGKFVNKTADLGSKYPSLWLGHLISWGGDEYSVELGNYPFLNEAVSKQEMIDYGMKLVNKANEACKSESVTFNTLASLATTPEKTEYMFDVRAGLLNIVTGTDDVEAMYDAFVEDAYSYDLQEVIDSMNEALA